MELEPEPLPDSRWHVEQRAIARENRAAEIREQEDQEACGIEEEFVDEMCDSEVAEQEATPAPELLLAIAKKPRVR